MALTIPSDLATASDSVPIFSAAQLSKLPGLTLIFADIAALNAAVTKERANIAAGTPIWVDGQQIQVASEAAEGVSRTWNRTAQHARTVRLRPGLSVTLAADSNVVRFATGTPAGGTGATGDLSVDWSANSYYTKGAGTWASTGSAYTASGSGAAASTLTGVTYDSNVPPRVIGYTLDGVVHTVGYTATTATISNASGSRVATFNGAGLLTGLI